MYTRGPDGFEEYYTGIFGHRWGALRAALLAGSPQVAWDAGAGHAYHLDPASVLVAGLLPLGEARDVVDLCAAPGGKSLVLASRLTDGARMVCNERSRARRARLQRVLETHLPADLRARVQTSGHDAARWGLHQPASCDAILADVPCSSEQHVLTDAAALNDWSPGRSRRLTVQQGAILAAAVDAARPGGWILYVTCALSPQENEGVVERILRKRSGLVTVERPTADELAAAADKLLGRTDAAGAMITGVAWTGHGLAILPDTCGGAGPLYAARLRRTPAPTVAVAGTPAPQQ